VIKAASKIGEKIPEREREREKIRGSWLRWQTDDIKSPWRSLEQREMTALRRMKMSNAMSVTRLDCLWCTPLQSRTWNPSVTVFGRHARVTPTV